MAARLRKQPVPSSNEQSPPGPSPLPPPSEPATVLSIIKEQFSLIFGLGSHWPIYPEVFRQVLVNLNLSDSILNMFGAKSTFDPEKDIPDLTGKVIIVTGGNTGLGKYSVLEFARHGAKVYMASRTESKARQSIDEIKATVPTAQIEFLHLDLTSLASIKHAADEFLSKETSLHILLNNAGVMAMSPGLTEDGFDVQWGTNHIGHALLTKLLLPTLLRTAEISPKNSVRIVNLTSEGHRITSVGINFADTALATSNRWTRYGQSKLANVLYAKALAKRYGDKNIVAVSCHPGIVNTDLYLPWAESLGFIGNVITYPMKLLTVTPQVGSYTQIALCTSPEVTVADGGSYYTPVFKKSTPSAYARDDELADKLWDYTEEILREKGY